MADDGVTIGLFPEQVIGGYPPEDLIQWQGFVDHQWLQLLRVAHETADLNTVFAVGVAVIHQGLRYNCAAVIAGGQILGLVPKEKLPTYSIYYEGRTMARGTPLLSEEVNGIPFGDFLFKFDFGVVAAEVCEDLWSPDGPMKRRTYAGAELVVNLSS
jgi:NAD+ synthase (glutamine-hydrolysing)